MFLKLVEEEIERSRKLYGDMHSFHEGLGILEEEFWEVKLEIFKKNHDKEAILKELVQLASMCYKLSIDLNLIKQATPPKPDRPPLETFRKSDNVCLR